MDKKTIVVSAIIIVGLLAFFLSPKFLGISPWPTEILALILSGIAIIISVLTFSRTQKTSMMPVLVFVRRSEKIWQIQNVGKGPAVTVKIADRDHKDNKWNAILFSPIAAGASLNLDTLGTETDFGAVYTDIKGNVYSSLYIKNINEFFEKNKFPEWKPHSTEWQRKESRENTRKMF